MFEISSSNTDDLRKSDTLSILENNEKKSKAKHAKEGSEQAKSRSWLPGVKEGKWEKNGINVHREKKNNFSTMQQLPHFKNPTQ